MFLQMQNRRQFLERSAWGFGSAFVLPSLLQSCTDHNLPGPDGPDPGGTIIYPPLKDDNIDWNDDAKTTVSSLLGLVPDVGDILSGLVDIFWPTSGDDVWGQVRAQVEALVAKKIADDDYNRVSATLDGLQKAFRDYTSISASTDLVAVGGQWVSSRTVIDAAQDTFQQKGDEVLLLPLFAQYANMNLAMYRDGVAFGRSWGWDDIFLNAVITQLQTNIINFTSYAKTQFELYFLNLQNTTPPDSDKNEPFKTSNRFHRQMTLWVLDYMDTWQYYDATKYPNGAVLPPYETPIPLFNREIFSDPYGNTYLTQNYIPIFVPNPATQRPTQITVWSGSRIDAVQLSYPGNSGPNGAMTTPRMGDQNGGSPNTFLISPDNPIIQFQVSYSWAGNSNAVQQAVDTMQFRYNDNSTTNQMGEIPAGGANLSGWVGWNYMALSSIYMVYNEQKYQGSSEFATCVVFGFLYWNLPSATLRAIARNYITSPRERLVADFAKAFPKLGLSANSISEELKAARKAYWEYIKKRVK